MDILSKEGETKLLLEELQKHPSQIFIYGKQLSGVFPSETFALCLDEIRRQAAEADNRTKYQKVCSNIKKLFDYGGVSEANNLIDDLKAAYFRRPAMIDELDRLIMRLAKKRNGKEVPLCHS